MGRLIGYLVRGAAMAYPASRPCRLILPYCAVFAHRARRCCPARAARDVAGRDITACAATVTVAARSTALRRRAPSAQRQKHFFSDAYAPALSGYDTVLLPLSPTRLPFFLPPRDTHIKKTSIVQSLCLPRSLCSCLSDAYLPL